MPASPTLAGRRLGVYQVHSLLGVGGMGEVYRARDTKLDRDVAIKILPHDVADDPDRLARFGREARVLASLNHPHIGAIYGFEEALTSDGLRVSGLVLELVEGDTLAERLNRGTIPIRDALPIARQIAEALDAAHQRASSIATSSRRTSKSHRVEWSRSWTLASPRTAPDLESGDGSHTTMEVGAHDGASCSVPHRT